MKKILCRRCGDYFTPGSHWVPFELVPATTRCHQNHPVETSFEMRAEITARKLFELSLVAVFVVALVASVPSLGVGVGLFASLFAAAIGGGLIGVLLYQLAAVPLQLLVEGGAAIGGAAARMRAPKRSAAKVTDEERRLLEHVKKPARRPPPRRR